MSRPKKTLPVLGQASQAPEVKGPEATRDGADGSFDACTDDCCQGTETAETLAATPRTREADPEVSEGDAARGAATGVLEKTVVRVTGMDCASCAATVERRVGQLPGVHAATVNFAAGRLDAEHDPGVKVAEIERAVEGAGYGVERPGEAETVSFWGQPRVLLTLAGGLLFALGAALGLSGAPGLASSGAYAAAIVVGGLPIFRAALSSIKAKHADMNRGVGRGGAGSHRLRRGQRPPGLRRRPDPWRRAGAGAPGP